MGGRVLLVFGGSQGARSINAAVAEWLRAGEFDWPNHWRTR